MYFTFLARILSVFIAAMVFFVGCSKPAAKDSEMFEMKEVTPEQATEKEAEAKCGGPNGCGSDTEGEKGGEHKCGGAEGCGSKPSEDHGEKGGEHKCGGAEGCGSKPAEEGQDTSHSSEHH